MKKYILFALFMNLTTAFSYSQVRINVQGGAGFNSITKSTDYDGNFGFRFGVGVELPMEHNWSFQTGLQILNRKSSAGDGMSETIRYNNQDVLCLRWIESKIHAVYFQIPVKIAAYLPLNKNCGLQIGAGPYVSYGIIGNVEGKTVEKFHPDIHDVIVINPKDNIYMGVNANAFEKDYGLKRVDMGLSIGVDFKYKSFFVGCGVEYGLIPIDKEFPKDILKATFKGDRTMISPHNFGVELHVGYSFCVVK